MSDDGFPFTAAAMRRPVRAVDADLPRRKPASPPNGPCAVCGEPATRKVNGRSRVCDAHYRGYNLLNARGYPNAVGVLKGLYQKERNDG